MESNKIDKFRPKYSENAIKLRKIIYLPDKILDIFLDDTVDINFAIPNISQIEKIVL